jgi:hypothetical protein
LGKKQAILLVCPTPNMIETMDNFFRKTYDAILSATFSLSRLQNKKLARVLARHYLGSVA